MCRATHSSSGLFLDTVYYYTMFKARIGFFNKYVQPAFHHLSSLTQIEVSPQGLLWYAPFLFLYLGALFPDFDVRIWGTGDYARFRRNTLWKHRGLFHTLIFPFILYLFLVLFVIYMHYSLMEYTFAVFIPFLIGDLVHLFLDSFTVSGIQPFMPFSYKRVKLGTKIHTGDIFDHMIGVGFFIATLVGLYFIIA